MILFNPCLNNFEPRRLAVTPKRLFVEGAIKALWDTASSHRDIILSDLAVQAGCDIDDLTFLIETRQTESDVDIAVPDFRAVLTA